ncbi:MAG TPA: HIT domain-containing protein [bacterium]|nr:HIT domain-containing protein [bacterium]
MKPIFAPWRMEFILGPREKGCVFCNRVKRKSDRKDLILHRGKSCFVILNKYPYNPGHLMVVPNRHVSSLTELNAKEHEEIFSLLARAEKALSKSMRPQGFNMGMNLGKAAGAGIDDHIHFHVIPRWFADTNFWPVIAETKSMPQHLLDTYDLLKKFWK